MRRFRFKLEPVRSLREQAETSAKEALARELAAQRDCDEALAQASERLDEARRAAASHDGVVEAAKLRSLEVFVERRELEQAIAGANAATQAERVEAGRRQLTQASQDRQVIEKLKERRKRRHEELATRAEEKLLEDVGLSVHRRGDEPSAA